MFRRYFSFLFVGFLVMACQPRVVVNDDRSLTAQPVLPEIQGSIAFIGADGDIYLTGGPGGKTLNLTNDATSVGTSRDGLVTYREPTWSPAGDLLAYVRRTSLAEGGEEFKLEIFHTETGSTTTLFASEEYYPFYLYWSPDGASISFLTTGDGADLNLWVGQLDGEPQILDQGQPYYWLWLDEERLFVHSGGSIEDNPETARLRILSPDPTSSFELDISPLNFQSPENLQTGDEVVIFGRHPTDGEGLYLLSSIGELLAKVGKPQGRVAFEISATGRYLAILSSAASRGALLGELVLIDILDPLNPQVLPAVGERVVAFWWSPTDDRLLYLEPYVAPDDNTRPVRYQAQAEPSLRFRAQVHDPMSGNSYPLLTFSPTQEFLRVMQFFDQYQRSSTFWSPDGSQIVYPALVAGGEPGIFILDVEGETPPIRIGDGILAYWSSR